MPRSSKEGKPTTLSWIRNMEAVKTVLDVGVGVGTYRDYCWRDSLLRDSIWWGVEAWEPYIEEFKLRKKYHHLINDDARFLDWTKLPTFDLVLFGDVLEHMSKTSAQSLVNAALENSRYVIISIPIMHLPQGAIYGNPFEIHVKDDWTHEEVLESFPNIIDSSPGKIVGVYLLKGKHES